MKNTFLCWSGLVGPTQSQSGSTFGMQQLPIHQHLRRDCFVGQCVLGLCHGLQSRGNPRSQCFGGLFHGLLCIFHGLLCIFCHLAEHLLRLVCVSIGLCLCLCVVRWNNGKCGCSVIARWFGRPHHFSGTDTEIVFSETLIQTCTIK